MSAAESMAVESPFTAPELEQWAGYDSEEARTLRGAELDARIDWLLEKRHELHEQIKANEEVAQKRMDMIRRWADEQNATLERQDAYLESLLLQHAVAYEYPAGKKSRTLAYGKFGRRITQRAGIKIVDENVALQFAKQNEIPVKVTEKVQVSALKEWHESTGKLPEGCEPVPEIESVYVEVR